MLRNVFLKKTNIWRNDNKKMILWKVFLVSPKLKTKTFLFRKFFLLLVMCRILARYIQFAKYLFGGIL